MFRYRQMNYDVAIIGAGIVGAACGASLSASGLRVIVLESNNIAAGATAAGMGHIVLMDDSEAQLALTGYSRMLWNELAKEFPSEAEYDRCGTIWVAADEEEMSEVGRKKSVNAAHGAEAEILDAHSLRELEPNLRFFCTLRVSASSGPGLNDLVGSPINMPINPRSPGGCGVTSMWISWPLRRMVRSVTLPPLREIASLSCVP